MSRLFFLGENMNFPARTINEMAKIHGRFYPSFDSEMLRENLSAFGFNGDESLKSLSLGNRKKAQIAYAISLRTSILLLDEPTNGLDITSKQVLQNIIARCIDESQTLIVSTHTVSELQNLYDSVIILSKGQLLLAMPTFDIIRRISFRTSPIPPSEFIYKEMRMGLNQYIVPVESDNDETDVNYTLLYNALMSPARDTIINILTQ